MVLHDGKFFIRKLSILIQDQVGHRNFSDIMERSGLLELVDIGIRQDSPELPLGLKFLCNGLDILSRLLDMVTRAFIARFNHLGKFHDNDFLHALDALVLVMHLLDKVERVIRHRIEVVVKLPNFIFGLDPETCDIVHGISHTGKVQIKAHVQSIVRAHRRPSNLLRCIGHLVHRNHDPALHQLENNHHDDNRKPEEKRQKLDKEHRLVADNRFHGNVCRHVGNRFPGGVPKGLVNRQEPAKLVIRNNRLNLFAIQKLWQIRQERRIKFKYGTWLAPRLAIYVQVKNDMAAVFHDLVDIEVFCMRKTFLDLFKNPLYAVITFSFMATHNILIHPFCIDRDRRRFRHTTRGTYIVVDRIVAIQEQPDYACKSTQKHLGDNHHQDNLVQKGIAERSLFRRIAPGKINFAQIFLDMIWNKVVDERRQQNNHAFVKNINDDIGTELRSETVPVHQVMERNRKRRRNPFAKIKAV